MGDIANHKKIEEELKAANQQLAAANRQLEANGQQLLIEINEHKLAEDKLKEKDKFIEYTIQNSAVATFVVDLHHKIIYWNMACEELTGAKAIDLIGTSDHWKAFYDYRRPCVADLIIDNNPGEMATLYNIYSRSTLVPNGLHAEGWYSELGGKDRYILFDAAPIYDVNGELIAAIETLNDITERKKAEDKLREVNVKLSEAQDQLIQAEKLNAIGLLASGVAHEVRNPLGIIIQGVNYLEKKLSAKEKDIFEILTMMKDGVKRADKIINGLLDFSRVTTLNLQSEDINSVLLTSLTLVKNQFIFENIEIIKELKTDIPKVLIDKNKIEQVCINILLNAAQAMPEGGKIIIRSYVKQLEEIKNGLNRKDEDILMVGKKAVILEFEDTGIGISQENISKIFDPFFTTRGPRGGTGLGLTVSQSILHMHKGLMHVESQVGKGTKITVILKLAEE